jgi:steroid delta-isomerase-like uncharacterized protein
MSTHDNITVVRRFVDHVINQGDLSLAGELWAEDLIWRGGSLGEVHGIAAYKQMLAANVGGAFTGMRLDIQQIIADGDTVVLLFTNSGTHEGEFLGVPGTGRTARWLGVGVYRVLDGKIVEATFVEDILGMLVQLGITELPSEG